MDTSFLLSCAAAAAAAARIHPHCDDVIATAVLSQFHGNLTNSPWHVIITAAAFKPLPPRRPLLLLHLYAVLHNIESSPSHTQSIYLSSFVHFMLAITKIHKIPN